MISHDKLFTHTLTNDTFTTNENWGIRKLSVMCTSDTAISVLGTRELDPGGISSTAITLAKGESFTWSNTEGIEQITIDATGGATAIISAI